MKKFNTLLCALFFAAPIFAQTVSTFENLTLATDTFWDGSDLSGGFSNGNANFANDYDTTYHSWSGFVYSDKKDSLTAGYGNQYAAVTGAGYGGSSNYAVADDYGNAKVRLTGSATGKMVKGFYVTNTTFAYQSMKQGDAFAKKFGGATGTDPDWFRLRAMGWLNGAMKAQSVDFFLADFRSADSTQDYIVHNWTWLNLETLGAVDSLIFQLTSSDTAFGFMNTPAYFAMDNFTTADVTYAAPVATNDYVSTKYTNDTLIEVLSNDLNLIATPVTVRLISIPMIPGAFAYVDSNRIYYQPEIGVVAQDTLVYSVCDALNACDTAVVYINVTSVTGLHDLTNSALQFAVYPNPFAGDEIHVVTSDGNIGSELSVFDLSGKLMSTGLMESESANLNTEKWSGGIYFVKLSNATGASIKKIVKQ